MHHLLPHLVDQRKKKVSQREKTFSYFFLTRKIKDEKTLMMVMRHDVKFEQKVLLDFTIKNRH